MPLDSAQWMIQLRAADQTAGAFNSLMQRMKQTQIVANGVQQGMSAGFAGVTRMMGPLSVAFLAGAAAHKVWAAGIKAANMGEHAEQIGLTTDQLQAYRLAAAQNGVSVEQLDGAMMRLARTMGEANNGSDEAIARFDKLGIKLLDTNKELRSSADVMPELARALLDVKSETERNALMMEFFGRSGSRMVTVLKSLAEGNDAIVASAKAQGAVISGEVIDAWDKLDDQLQVTSQRMDTFLATIGRPVAAAVLQGINVELDKLLLGLRMAQKGIEWLTGKGADTASGLDKQVEILNNDIVAFMERGYTNDNPVLQDLIAKRDALLAQLNSKPISMPEITVTGDAGGAEQPISNKDKPKGTGGKGNSDAVREAQKQMDELIASIEKVRKASEGVLDKYGDGAARAARETAELNEMLQMGFIDSETYGRAIEDVTAAYDDQSRALRGAAGGFEGYTAGIEQAFADMNRTNAAFEAGRETVNLLSDALTELATTGEINFQRLLNSFISMLIEMEMRAAASAVFKAVGGGGGIGGLIGSLIRSFSSGSPTSGEDAGGGPDGGNGTYALGGVFNRGNVIPFANGGIVNKPTLFPFANGTGLMGEAGPEAIMPLSRGADGKLGVRMDGGGGEGVTVIVNQTVHVGEFVTTQQYAAGLRSVEQSAREGAMAGIINKRKRGGLKDVF